MIKKLLLLICLLFTSIYFVTLDLFINFTGADIANKVLGGHYLFVTPKDSSNTATNVSIFNLPTENFGSGTFNIALPSGSSATGAAVFSYIDAHTTNLEVAISLRQMEGTLLTHFYIDGEEVEQKQIGAGYDGSLTVPQKFITVGTHTIHATQFKADDINSGAVFNQSQTFELKAK